MKNPETRTKPLTYVNDNDRRSVELSTPRLKRASKTPSKMPDLTMEDPLGKKDERGKNF